MRMELRQVKVNLPLSKRLSAFFHNSTAAAAGQTLPLAQGCHLPSVHQDLDDCKIF